MSADTPRTDELATFRPNDDGVADFMPAEFARELERESARLREAARGVTRVGIRWIALFAGLLSPHPSPLVGSVSVGGAFEKLRIYVEIIPRNITDIVRKPFEHVPNGCGPVNDSFGYEFLDDAIFNAESIGSRILCDVEPQNLFLVFSESVQSLRDALKLFPSPPPSFYPVKDVAKYTDSEKSNGSDKGDSEPRAIILCKVKDAKLLEKALGTKKKKGRKEAQRYEIAWSELEEFKNRLGYLGEHISIANVRDHRCLAVAGFLAWSEATAGSMTLVGIRWIALLGLSPLEWAAIGFVLGYGVLMLGYWTKRLISFNRSKTQVRQKHQTPPQ